MCVKEDQAASIPYQFLNFEVFCTKFLQLNDGNSRFKMNDFPHDHFYFFYSTETPCIFFYFWIKQKNSLLKWRIFLNSQVCVIFISNWMISINISYIFSKLLYNKNALILKSLYICNSVICSLRIPRSKHNCDLIN